ncbi:hypothetical protein [Nesterenkonia rhizosphaerae]
MTTLQDTPVLAVGTRGASGTHTALKGDNLAHLQQLIEQGQRYDFVLLDPPYNTGTNRSTYLNVFDGEQWATDFGRRVEASWALMGDDAVMLVTIDERSLHPTLKVLETHLPPHHQQIVTVRHSPAGQAQRGFRRTCEYLIFVHKGAMAPKPRTLGPWWNIIKEGSRSSAGKIRWNSLLKTGQNHTPASSPGCFYALRTDGAGRIVAVGDAEDWQNLSDDSTLIYPVRTDGSLGRWRVGVERARYLHSRGLLRLGRSGTVSYACSGLVDLIDRGDVKIVSYDDKGAAVLADQRNLDELTALPGTLWDAKSHSYSTYGSWLLKKMVPGLSFSHPKSLYAMEDALAFYLADLPQARILDVYAGSGTLAHAAMLLNASDQGSRSTTSITLDDGSFDVLTARLTAALTGTDRLGQAVEGAYMYPDRGLISSGLVGTLQLEPQ